MKQFTHHHSSTVFIGLAALVAAFLIPAQSALAATRIVMNTDDSGSGSLRQTILDASSGDQISFSSTKFNTAVTITLSSEIEISKSLVINGAAGSVVTPTLSGNNTNRIFLIDEGASVGLNRLKFVYGNDGDCDTCNGGAIHNEGVLTISNSTFVSNTSGYSNGGALYNGGVLTITAGAFHNNTALGWSGGGAIANAGQTYIVSNTFSNNNAQNADGGAIHNDYGGVLIIASSVISGNRSADKGGGIYNNGTASIIGNTFTGNRTPYGGAILNWSDGAITITSSVFLTNEAYSGGGIYNQDGLVNVITATFSGNRTSSVYSGDGDHYGGGIYSNGVLSVADSQFLGNCVANGYGGGIGSDGLLTVNGSTFKGNIAPSGMGGGLYSAYTGGVTNSMFLSNSASFGGGMNVYGDLRVVNSTLTDNSADGSGPYVASCTGTMPQPVNNGTDYGGSIAANSATLINTLLSGDPIGGNCATFNSVIIDGSHNLEDANTCGFTSPTSLTNTNPRLEPFRVNVPGLPIPTLGIPYNSPAVDAGAPDVCPATDVRGIRRPIGARCDIGAYEAFSKVVFTPFVRR